MEVVEEIRGVVGNTSVKRRNGHVVSNPFYWTDSFVVTVQPVTPDRLRFG